MPNFTKLQKLNKELSEKDFAGSAIVGNKLVDQPARAGEHPENRAKSSNLRLANGICALHGVKHAGPCPAEIEVPVSPEKEKSDEEDNA